MLSQYENMMMIMVMMTLIMISMYPAIPIVQDCILCGMDWQICAIPMDCSCLCLLLVILMVLSFFKLFYEQINLLAWAMEVCL